jgi:hypothetical protein
MPEILLQIAARWRGHARVGPFRDPRFGSQAGHEPVTDIRTEP